MYSENISEQCETVATVVSIIREEFKSSTRQSRIRKNLQSIRVSAIIESKRCPVPEALEEVRERAIKFYQKGTPQHRPEQDKVEYLYKAVIGASWAKASIANALSAKPQCSISS